MSRFTDSLTSFSFVPDDNFEGKDDNSEFIDNIDYQKENFYNYKVGDLLKSKQSKDVYLSIYRQLLKQTYYVCNDREMNFDDVYFDNIDIAQNYNDLILRYDFKPWFEYDWLDCLEFIGITSKSNGYDYHKLLYISIDKLEQYLPYYNKNLDKLDIKSINLLDVSSDRFNIKPDITDSIYDYFFKYRIKKNSNGVIPVTTDMISIYEFDDIIKPFLHDKTWGNLQKPTYEEFRTWFRTVEANTNWSFNYKSRSRFNNIYGVFFDSYELDLFNTAIDRAKNKKHSEKWDLYLIDVFNEAYDKINT